LVWDAIQYLDRILLPQMQVMEVGGGNSTLWLLERGVAVHTIEPNSEWIAELRRQIEARFEPAVQARWQCTRAKGEEAIDLIRDLPAHSYDIVIVDPKGQEIPRFEALQAARPKLRENGRLVLDNSDHPNNLAAVDSLGKPHKVVTGYGAMCLVVTQTAFWQF